MTDKELSKLFANENLFVSDRGRFFSELESKVKIRAANFLEKLDIAFEILLALFSEEYSNWYYNNFNCSIDNFIIEEDTGKVGVYSRTDGSIGWLDELNKTWFLRE